MKYISLMILIIKERLFIFSPTYFHLLPFICSFTRHPPQILFFFLISINIGDILEIIGVISLPNQYIADIFDFFLISLSTDYRYYISYQLTPIHDISQYFNTRCKSRQTKLNMDVSYLLNDGGKILMITELPSLAKPAWAYAPLKFLVQVYINALFERSLVPLPKFQKKNHFFYS